MRWKLLLALLLLLVVVSAGQEARGAVQPSGLSVNVEAGTTRVSVTLSIFQNLTALVGSFVLPQTDGALAGSNSSTATTALQNAIQALTPNANVNNLKLGAVSTPWSNTTDVQWLNISLSFGVDESSLGNSNGVQFDTAWRSFAVPSSISLGGLEVNKIGSAYLLGAAETLQGFSNTKTINYAYHVNNAGVSLPSLPARVADLSVLNFSSLAVPLSKWTPAYNYATNSVTWSLTSLPINSLVIIETVSEAQPAQFHYQLTYGLHEASITAPLRSSIKGDTISVVFGDTNATLMGLIITSASIIAITTTLYERRILAKTIGKRTRR